MQELIVYIITAAGLVVSSYLLGHMMTLAGGVEGDGGGFAYTFRRLSLGALLTVTLYALFNCAGATVLACVIPLLMFGVRFGMPRWRRIEIDPAAAALFCGVFVLMAALRYLSAHDLAGNIYSLHIDHSFYAALANYVGRTGIESTNMELMYPALQSPAIYHWFDAHMTAMAGALTGNYFNARLLVTIPLAAAAAVTGVAAVIEKYCDGGRKAPWFALMALLVPVVLVSFIKGKYEFGALAFHNAISEKIFIMVCVVAWTAICENKILPLVVGGLLVSSAAPALFTAAFIVLLVRLWRGWRSASYWKDAAILALGGLWCVAFYTLTARENPYFIHFQSMQQLVGEAFTDSSLPEAMKGIQVFAARAALNMAPCVLLFALLSVKDRRRAASMLRENGVLLLAIVTGFLFACPLWFMRDAMQLTIEVSVPVAFVLQTLLLAMLLTGEGRWRKIAATAVVAAGMAVIWIYGGEFRGGQLNGEFTRKVAATEGPVVWVDTVERREGGNEYVRDVNYIVPFSVVRRLRNDYFPIRLDVYDIVYDQSNVRDYAVLASIENSTFYRWVESRKIPMNELHDAQTRFIKENGIHYVITPSNDVWIYNRGFRIEEETKLESRGYTLYKISYDDPAE